MPAIAFDVDDTLYDLAWPFKQAVREFFGDVCTLDLDKLFIRSRIRSDEAYELVLAGLKPIEFMHVYRAQMAFRDFGYEISRDEALALQRVYEKFQGLIRISPAMRSLIGECSSASWAVGIISNGDSDHQWDKVTAIGVPDLVPRDRIVISGDVGFCKPDARIFKAAEEKLGFGSDACWFVGDTYENDVIGALAAGWRCIWFNRRGKVLAADDPKPTIEVETEEDLVSAVQEVLHGAA